MKPKLVMWKCTTKQLPQRSRPAWSLAGLVTEDRCMSQSTKFVTAMLEVSREHEEMAATSSDPLTVARTLRIQLEKKGISSA
jgi:hypothetical protein